MSPTIITTEIITEVSSVWKKYTNAGDVTARSKTNAEIWNHSWSGEHTAVQSKLKGGATSRSVILTLAFFGGGGRLMWTSVSQLRHPATYLFIYNHESGGGGSQLHNNTALETECPKIPVSTLPLRFLLPVSRGLAVFSRRVQLWGVSSYFGRLSVEPQHFAALCPGPITRQAFLRTTPPSHTNSAAINMRNKVVTTAEGKRRVWLKRYGQQKSSVCKEICLCQVGAEVRLGREAHDQPACFSCNIIRVTWRAAIKHVLKCFLPNNPAPHSSLNPPSQLVCLF